MRLVGRLPALAARRPGGDRVRAGRGVRDALAAALAVAMIANGTSIPVVSAVLGHASSDTTQAYYLRFDVERLRCCALDVEEVIERAAAGEHDA